MKGVDSYTPRCLAVSPVRPRRMVVGVSGASGVVYGARLLEALRTLGIETHLVISKPGDLTRAYESVLSGKQFRSLADVVHAVDNVGAAISSGSFRTMGMVIAPCSMRTLAEVATGAASNLLTRAADVVLKERRRLVLLVREAPLSLIHLRNMVAATEAGAVVFPPVPAFYTKPQTLEDVVDHTVGRVLDLFDLEMPGLARWGDDAESPPTAARAGCETFPREELTE
jgi:flavin prenyltransferase